MTDADVDSAPLHAPAPAEAAPRTGRGTALAAMIAIVAATLFVYWPALRGDFLWDDELDVTGNLLLRDAAGLAKIWFHPVGLYDYYPIKYTVQWLQWQLWGAQPLGYHLTNVVLHAVSALLVWRVLARLGLRRGWLGGLLFAVHPLAVESVAWITELKNTLSLPLLLLAFDRSLAFDARNGRGDYVAALGLFLAALLCKTAVVMFPATLLVYAWWRRGRIGRGDVRATTPFFALSLVLGLVTVWFQHHRAIGPDEVAFDPVGGWGARLACAGSSLAFYAWKALLPMGLLPMYRQWPVNPPSAWLLLPWAVLAALAAICWQWRATWGRHVLFGVAWFTLHLLPVLGLVPISSQRFSWVMDHLAYVALLGPIALAAAAGDWLLEHTGRRGRVFVPVGWAAATLTLAWLAHAHARIFHSETALWTHTVERNPTAWMALYNLGNFAGRDGQPERAVEFYRKALAVRANYPEAWNNLGNELRHLGRTAEAIAAYEQAVRLKPDHFAAHNNLGAALAAAGRTAEAIAECEQALRINPRFAPAHRNVGNILAGAGRGAEAVPHLQQALRLQPAFPEAENDLGVALADAGRGTDAVACFERALRLRPDYAEAHNNLGSTLRELGRRDEAAAAFRAALRARPSYPSAHYNLACTLLDQGQTAAAVAELEETLRASPEHPDAHFMLGNIRALAGDAAAALRHYDDALRCRPGFAEAHRNAAVLLLQGRRIPDAIAHLRRAIELKPDFADAHLSLAAAYQAAGQMREAVEHYEKARQLKPELPPLAR